MRNCFTFIRFAVATALILGMPTSVAFAQIERGDRWVLLEKKLLDPAETEHDVDLSQKAGSYKAIRLRAGRQGLAFSDLSLFYIKDRPFIEPRRIVLRRRQRSKPFDLRKKERFLDALSFNYRAGRRTKPLIEIWGLQSRKGRTASREDFLKTQTTTVVDPETNSATNAGDSTSTSSKDEKILPNAAGTVSDISNKPEEILLGADNIHLNSGTTTIKTGAETGKFQRLRLGLANSGISVNAIEVNYSDGQSERFDINKRFGKNSSTPWLDLTKDGFIKDLKLTYKARPYYRGKARVEVFGLFREDWLKHTAKNTVTSGGWIMLGSQTANFTGFENDIIKLDKDSGAIDQVKLNVRDRAITLKELHVVYGNGNVETIPARKRISAGRSFGPVKIAQSGQYVKEIHARYRSRFLDPDADKKGRAIVEIWGRTLKRESSLQDPSDPKDTEIQSAKN